MVTAAPVVERVSRAHTETADRLASVLLKLGLMSKADLAALLCEFVKGERLLESRWPTAPVTLTQLNVSFLRAREIVPLFWSETGLSLACWDALWCCQEFEVTKPMLRVRHWIANRFFDRIA